LKCWQIICLSSSGEVVSGSLKANWYLRRVARGRDEREVEGVEGMRRQLIEIDGL